MNIGKLRHLVEIQTECEKRTESGAVEPYWKPVKSVWASIDPYTGKEKDHADSDLSEVGVKITMRHDPDLETITAKCRVSWKRQTDTLLYEVAAIQPQMYRGEATLFLCKHYEHRS